MEEKLQQALEEIKTSYISGVPRKELSRRMHQLAEAEYPPALELFQSLLKDADWDWRLEGLQLIGFHYDITSNEKLIKKIRQLLLNDPEDNIRITAASILGIRSQWPDNTLVMALQSDPNQFVRYSAFEALLKLARVPYPMIQKEVNRLEKSETEPTLAEVKRILQEANINLSLSDED